MTNTARPRTSNTTAIAGFLIAGTVLLGLGFFARSPRDAIAVSVPAIRIIQPAHGDEVDNPVTVTFTTTSALELTRSGWSARDMHLHLMVDDLELMPAAADITIVGDSTFAWRLPHLEAGSRRIYLTWAGRHHGNLTGDADTVLVHVR